jgi:O-Antigen ligase
VSGLADIVLPGFAGKSRIRALAVDACLLAMAVLVAYELTRGHAIRAAALCALIALALLALRPLSYIVVAAISLLPFSFIVGYFHTNYDFLEISSGEILVVLAALGIAMLRTQSASASRLSLPPWPANVFAVLTLVPLAQTQSLSVGATWAFAVWCGWLVMFVVVNLPWSFIRRCLWYFTAATFVAAILAIVLQTGFFPPLARAYGSVYHESSQTLAEYLGGTLSNGLPVDPLDMVSVTRANFNSVHPNGYAAFLILALGIGVLAISEIKTTRLRVAMLLLGYASVLVTTVALTYSRGGAVSLAVACVVMGLLLLRSLRLRALLALLLLVGVGLVGLAYSGVSIVPRAVSTRASSVENYSSDVSIQFRIKLAAAVAREAVAHPLGLGYSGLRADKLPEDISAGMPNLNNAHDLYLQIAVESGLPALAAFMALLIAVYRRSLHKLRGDQTDVLIGAVVLASVLGVCLDGFGEALLILDPLLVMVAFCVFALPFCPRDDRAQHVAPSE